MKLRNLPLMLLAAFLLYSCQKDLRESITEDTLQQMGKRAPEDKFNTFYGPQVQMGDGRVRTFITISHTGVPSDIGIEMTAGAFHGLTTDPMDHDAGTFVLTFHPKALEVTPYKHVLLNWNPKGHEPPHIYGLPHFDFHFYMISNAERMNIPPYEVAPTLFDNYPPAGHIPPTYFPIPGGVPQMGTHWIDLTSPEISGGQTFTNTFIYGSYNGKVIFHEPMITLAVLQSKTTYNLPIAQPNLFSTSNTYYPTKYNIYAADNKHYVTFSDFVWR